MVYLLMGVMGSGKTTVGKERARRLGCAFHDGDDYHPEANRLKMGRGIPLTDADREPWLLALRSVIEAELAKGGDAVVACSALRKRYRRMLIPDVSRVRLVYLKGDKALIASRLQQRTGSFASNDLLDSQFKTLEEPRDALVVDISKPLADIVERIRTS